jgi:hypothetical protein
MSLRPGLLWLTPNLTLIVGITALDDVSLRHKDIATVLVATTGAGLGTSPELCGGMHKGKRSERNARRK